MSETDATIRPILGYFEQAVYHIVGTSVVNCESGTDLSAASSFSALSLAENDDLLAQPGISDTDVFMHFFLGEAFEAMQSEATPVTVLDTMSFEHVDRINHRLRDAKFHERYDEVVSTAIEKMSATSPEALDDFDGGAFAEMASAIHNEFVCEIEGEIRDYSSAAFEAARAEAIGQTQNFGLSIAGAVPVLGSLVTAYQAVDGYGKFLRASHKAGGLSTPEGFQMLGPEKKNEMLTEMIEKAILSEASKTRLLDGAKLICDFNAAKVARF